MIKGFFNTVLYEPLYNGLVFLIDIVPFADVGIAVVILTLAVKLVLFPLSIKMVKTQIAVRTLEPEIAKIKEKHKGNSQEQARQMMALYKERGVNPFSGILLLFVQIPIIFALYFVFFRGLPIINVDILYSFIPVPTEVNMHFLGLIDMSMKSVILAAMAGATQYFQMKFALPKMEARKDNPSFKEDLSRSFQMQMRYILPIVVLVIAYVISSAVALYWTTSNLFQIGQEVYVRRNIKKN